MTTDPPGYELLALLGFGGASGEVWRARDRSTGELVVLARPEGLDPAVLDRVALLRGPHLVGLRGVLDGDPPVLVLDHVGGGSLTSLVARRGRLLPGEVVTVAAPLAGALAQVHQAGLVHGALRASSVLLTPAGMPLLADAGLAEGTPEEDVRALARLCHELLGDAPVPRPLQAVLEAVLVPGQGPGPDAAAFGLALRRAQAALPVRLTGVSAEVAAQDAPAEPLPGRHRAPARRRERRRQVHLTGVGRPLLVTAVALVALVLAAGAGWSLGGRGASAGARLPPAGAPSAAVVPWAAVLDGLDRAREAAYRSADASALRGVHADGSSALAADTALLRQLSAAGRSALGVRHDLLGVRQLGGDATTARLRVRDVLRAHQVLGPDGRVVEQRPRGAPRSYDVVLVRAPPGWRLAEVSPD